MKLIFNWINPKLELSESPIQGKGMFAVQPCMKDETLVIFGGHVFDAFSFKVLPPHLKTLFLQIEDTLIIGLLTFDETDNRFITFEDTTGI